MVITCSARGCINQYTLHNNIAFFRFPLDNHRLLVKWLIAMRRRDFRPKMGSTICSEHFEKKDLLQVPGENKPRLRELAVPSIFPDVTYTEDEELLSPGEFLAEDSPDILFPRDRNLTYKSFSRYQDLPVKKTYTEKLSLVSLDQDPPDKSFPRPQDPLEEAEISTREAASQTANSVLTRSLIATAESTMLLKLDEGSQTKKHWEFPAKSPADKIKRKIRTVRRRMSRRSKLMLSLKKTMTEKGSFNSEIEMLWSKVHPE